MLRGPSANSWYGISLSQWVSREVDNSENKGPVCLVTIDPTELYSYLGPDTILPE